MVGFLQVFTGKTHTTLKASGVAAYPIHVTLQNFSDSFRRVCINSGISIIGYLPVKISKVSSPYDDDNIPSTSTPRGRLIRMEIVHSAMRFILKGLGDCELNGFGAKTGDGTILRCHPVLTNYVADMPEVNDMTATRGRVQTARPCHRCMVRSEELPFSYGYLPRTLRSITCTRQAHTQLKEEGAWLKANGKQSQARKCMERAELFMKDDSIAMYESFLESTPMVDYLGTYEALNSFSFEPLHNFHLDVSKLIKICMYNRLSSHTSFSPHGSVKKLRRKILRGCNDLLACYERESYISGLTFDNSSPDISDKLDGFFTEDGIRGMLEGKDYKAVDMVFPFVGAFIDMCCGDEESCPITKISSQYTEIMTTCLGMGVERGWTEEKLSKLEESIKTFKTLARNVLGDYQTSGMGVKKWHMLDHLVPNIRRYRGLHYIDAGPFEHAHLQFKKSYLEISQRKSTGLVETFSKFDHKKSYDLAQKLLRKERLSGNFNSSSRKSPKLYRDPSLSRDGYRFSFQEVCRTYGSARHLFNSGVEHANCEDLLSLRDSHNENVIRFLTQLGYQGSAAFRMLLLEERFILLA